MSINTTKDHPPLPHPPLPHPPLPHPPLPHPMRKYHMIVRIIVGLGLGSILVPLAVVFLLSAAVLLIPAVPIVAVAVLAALLVLAARGKQAWAASGLPQIDARPDRCPLPLARARVRSVM